MTQVRPAFVVRRVWAAESVAPPAKHTVDVGQEMTVGLIDEWNATKVSQSVPVAPVAKRPVVARSSSEGEGDLMTRTEVAAMAGSARFGCWVDVMPFVPHAATSAATSTATAAAAIRITSPSVTRKDSSSGTLVRCLARGQCDSIGSRRVLSPHNQKVPIQPVRPAAPPRRTPVESSVRRCGLREQLGLLFCH